MKKNKSKGPSKRYPRKEQIDDRTLITYTCNEVIEFDLSTIEGCKKLDQFFDRVTRINKGVNRFD